MSSTSSSSLTFAGSSPGSSPAGVGVEQPPFDADAYRERVYVTESHLVELIDAVVAADREVHIAIARRTQKLDAAREWARAMTDDPVIGRIQGVDRNLNERVMVSELACALRLSELTTTSMVREAHSLVHEQTATFSALSDGQISYRHAQVILDSVCDADEADRPEFEQRLLQRAETSTAARLNRFALRERERLHPEQAIERHTRKLAERSVYVDPACDGMAWLSAFLPAIQAEAIFNRLSDTGASLQGPCESRTLSQLRADVFAALMLDDGAHDAAAGWAGAPGLVVSTGPADSTDPAFTPSFRGIRPTVSVTVSAETLLGRSDAPGQLEGYGPIDPVTARRIAAQAPSFLRLLTHPETGAVLSVGRDRYKVPADLKSWLRLRDETCRFPGCARRAQRCDIDHITAWAAGGPTNHDNLIHLCRHHHRLKHLSRWRVESLHSNVGAVRWTAPSGRTYVTDPALALDPNGLTARPLPYRGAPGARSGGASGGASRTGSWNATRDATHDTTYDAHPRGEQRQAGVAVEAPPPTSGGLSFPEIPPF